jgi:hypothetical protein
MTLRRLRIFVGFDPRETAAYAVARASLRHAGGITPVHGLVLSDLVERALYYRPTETRDGKLWDVVSGAHMSTEFAITRFLVPELSRIMDVRHSNGGHGWALFMDCDVLVRRPLFELKDILNDSMAVMCVKHEHEPVGTTKMDGQVQTSYPRKNWSSVMAFNLDHPSNRRLDIEYVNNERGLHLHQFRWLEDAEIGELPPEWNWIPGVSKAIADPAIVHFSEGGPWFEKYANEPFADEWRAALHRWAR